MRCGQMTLLALSGKDRGTFSFLERRKIACLRKSAAYIDLQVQIKNAGSIVPGPHTSEWHRQTPGAPLGTWCLVPVARQVRSLDLLQCLPLCIFFCVHLWLIPRQQCVQLPFELFKQMSCRK